jgi:hypothetical protein
MYPSLRLRPTEPVVALVTHHLNACTSFLNVDSTVRALLRLPLDHGERLVLILNAIHDTALELFARLALVPRPVAWHTSLTAEGIAHEQLAVIVLVGFSALAPRL